MKLKKLLSIILIGTLVVSVFCYPLSAIAKEDYSYKIDKALAEKLEKMNDDDVIPVSVWLKDIDHESIKTQALQQIKGKVSDDVYKIAQATGNELELLKLKEKESSKSILQQKKDSLDIQKYIVAERKISADKYIKQNKRIIEKIIGEIKNEDYICKYVPNANLNLKKSVINEIIRHEEIDSVYYEPNIKLTYDDVERKDSYINEKTVSTEFYTCTGLDTMRSVYGFDGSGMRVGMLENSNVHKPYVTTRTIYNVNGPVNNNGTAKHPTIVAKLMVGCLSDYTGAIPYADLYYSCLPDGTSSIKPKMELLLDNQVTAINCSFGANIDGYNMYDDYSKWYDHVALYHSVHLVFSSGNYGSTGIMSTNMSYNSIIVGNCNNDGEIHSTSSYNNNISSYKPDIVAPGTGGNIIPDYPGPSTLEPQATSFSAPLVTSAVIQLAQSNAVLEVSPTLMKAFLMSGSKITSYMSSEPMYSQLYSENIALSRQYGSGMLNVVNSYVASGYNYYITGQASPSFTSQNTQKNVKGLNKKIRIALCWDKKVIISGTHSGANVTNKNLDRFRLKVTSPSGKIYKSSYEYDNKQMITIESGEKGMYSFTVERMTGSTSNSTVNYSIAYSIQT